eukprot:351929-Chlamydomonas_euryale.AAC.4
MPLSAASLHALFHTTHPHHSSTPHSPPLLLHRQVVRAIADASVVAALADRLRSEVLLQAYEGNAKGLPLALTRNGGRPGGPTWLATDTAGGFFGALRTLEAGERQQTLEAGEHQQVERGRKVWSAGPGWQQTPRGAFKTLEAGEHQQVEGGRKVWGAGPGWRRTPRGLLWRFECARGGGAPAGGAGVCVCGKRGALKPWMRMAY